MRAALIAALILAPVLAAPTFAQIQVGGISGGGMTFAQARVTFPGISRITFDKFDPDGDGVVAANKIPALQATYNVMYRNRN